MIIWLIATVVLLILEMLGGITAFLCVAVGTFVAMIAAICNLSLIWQVALCVIGIILAFIYIAPVMRNFYNNHRRHTEGASNMDALIGRTGRVTEKIPAQRAGMGRVQIDGDNWQALTSDHEPIEKGAIVKVESYDSIVITVTRAQKVTE